MTVDRAARSFVDLRAFAADAPIPSIDDPARAWSEARFGLEAPDGPVGVEALALDIEGGNAELLHDEIVVLLTGALSIEAGAAKLTLGKDDYAALPAGTAFRWTASSGARALVLSYRASTATGAVARLVDGEAERTPSAPPAAELLIGDETPACRQHVDYRSVDGSFYCGTWESTPYRRSAMQYHHSELMHLREGRVTLIDGDGRRMDAGPGDIVLFNRGGECAWDANIHIRKTFVIHRPN